MGSDFLFDEIEPTVFGLNSMALVFIPEHSEALCFALSMRKPSVLCFARYILKDFYNIFVYFPKI